MLNFLSREIQYAGISAVMVTCETKYYRIRKLYAFAKIMNL